MQSSESVSPEGQWGGWFQGGGVTSSAIRFRVVLPASAGDAGAGTAGEDSFDEAVRQILTRALERTGGKIYGQDGAAALLSLKPTTLQGKLRKYGLR